MTFCQLELFTLFEEFFDNIAATFTVYMMYGAGTRRQMGKKSEKQSSPLSHKYLYISVPDNKKDDIMCPLCPI